mmetsp:Transcript_18257/g.47080  ORF Transcript_18257/g.47080 Transcript_18257/m.47080 type:complete len:290 (-) Transcript_18257:265-1134(-)
MSYWTGSAAIARRARRRGQLVHEPGWQWAHIMVRGCRTHRQRQWALGSQEVVGHAASDMRLAAPRRRVKLQESVLELLIDLHDGGLVAAAVAVVRRGKERHEVLVVRPVVALHHELVRADDEAQLVGVVELLGNVRPECVPSAARRDAPSHPVVRIAPHQIAHRALVRDLLHAVERADLVERVDRRRQPAVGAEDLVLDKRCKRQVVEQVGERLPHGRAAVLAQALVVEAVHLRDLPALVIAAQEPDPARPSHLERHDERRALNRVIPTVHIVAKEDEVGVGALPCDVE